ncbi:glycoside hydrolase family 79 protein [Lophiostoma macrostomum CBS 122681]|uniref:Glycoside hydrolase family 79 protein n=1 Tax=Lophiostoma macrostomum CBS 122681 TaxID=1314788 RepID=A0A6A6T5F5_9PLEO|nr:glycoside hydrolase family 79 protein [Lophiostoma macrostomum CBS 122681]
MSYSIEFSSFPDFAGNTSAPNIFSYNLLQNLAQLSGSAPVLRVGGNTQDIAVFDSSLETALVGIFNTNISSDYPTTITIGPAYFESYTTLPGIQFVHGFNLGGNSSRARAGTLASVSYACKAIGNSLLYWEYGNEPDLFQVSGYRNTSYDETDYVDQWLNGTRAFHQELQQACPDMATPERFKFLAPSLAGAARSAFNTLDPLDIWQAGLNADRSIGLVSSHNYMGVSTALGITLQGTLMNHSNVIANVDKQVNESRRISGLSDELNPNVPFILGEHNSLARQGRPGLSNSFGAALWGLDYNLYIASQNISRSHMHMGTNYRYQAWQPIETNKTVKGTKPPYYGNAAVAAFMSHSNSTTIQVTHLDQHSEVDTSYAAHIDGVLSRIALLNLRTYNTSDWNSNFTSNYTRTVATYDVVLPSSCSGTADVKRLLANGSDAITGITWDGYSYNYELDNGAPVLLSNVTRGETVTVGQNGWIQVQVTDSSAAIVEVSC